MAEWTMASMPMRMPSSFLSPISEVKKSRPKTLEKTGMNSMSHKRANANAPVGSMSPQTNTSGRQSPETKSRNHPMGRRNETTAFVRGEVARLIPAMAVSTNFMRDKKGVPGQDTPFR